jgi:hypothetical protein
MKKITFCYGLRTAKRHFLNLSAGAALACLALPAQAGTTYVISTDGASLDPDYLNAIGASQGLATPGFVFLSPTTLGSINGTPLAFGGYAGSGTYAGNDTAVFGVAGDLNLGSGDQILGVGGKFLKIIVGNDAHIYSGANISVAGIEQFPGAGGGAGGMPVVSNAPTLNVTWFGVGSAALGNDLNGGNGTAGGGGYASGLAPVAGSYYWMLYPLPGFAGCAPIRGHTIPGVGGTNSPGPSRVPAAGGPGGAGGVMGQSSTFQSAATDGAAGSAGGAGQKGQDGMPGYPGGSATSMPSFQDFGGLYGGAGGGSGEQGAYGYGGGGGGAGGGGGQGGTGFFGNAGWKGGSGGGGGSGGTGGSAGYGGAGGSGGGGLEIVVKGTFWLLGTNSARGSDGSAGVLGNPGYTAPTPGLAGHPGGSGGGYTAGGQGGDGGNGGEGGKGGDGGQGGGGAGGTVSLAATRINWSLPFVPTGTVDVRGGMGGSNNAPSGIFRYRSEWDGAVSDFFAPTATRPNPYNSYSPGLVPFSAPDTNQNILNIACCPFLVGGSDMCGLASTNALGQYPDTSNGQTLSAAPGKPANAFAVVRRQNTNAEPAPVPLLNFVNITGFPLRNPALAVNRTSDTVLVTPQPLQVGGYARDPIVSPGASGPQTLTELTAYNTWLTFLRPGASVVTAIAAPYANTMTFSALMNDTDPNQDLWLLDTGLLSVGTTISSPVVVDRQTNSATCSPQTRAGVPGTVTIQIKNVGHPASLMSSVAGSGVTFSNLPPSPLSLNVHWAVGTSTNLGVQQPLSFKVASDAGTVNLTANLNVIGPIPLFNLTGGGSAGPVLMGQPASLIFSALNNFHLDPGAFPQPPPALYDLRILGVSVSGPDAAFFTLTGPTNGLAPLNASINDVPNADPWATTIVFTPNAYRAYNATLTVLTDVNAVAGQPGQLFTYALSGSGTNLGISITQQPTDALAQPGGTASFSVVAQAYGVSGPLTYQWLRGASPIPNATSATYTTGPLSSTDNGAVFSCSLSAGPYAVSSSAATLIVVDTSTPYPQAVLADNPLLYYRFEEPPTVSTAYDSSTNGYNGLYYTDLSHADSATPSLGSSAVFHGDANPGAVLCHGIPFLRTQFSVEAWAYLNSWNTNTDIRGKYGISSIFSAGESAQGSFLMGAVNSNIFQFSVANALSDSGGLSDFQVTNNSYTTGKWFHLVAVYDLDNAMFNFYVNGSLVDSITLFDGPAAAIIYPTVGAWWSSNNLFYRFLDGRVDELAIYGTPLTADRVAAHYHAAFAAVTRPLLIGTRQGSSLQLSWSGGTGFMLQQTTNPGDPSSWSDVTAGNISPVTVNLNLSQQFFRLRKL